MRTNNVLQYLIPRIPYGSTWRKHDARLMKYFALQNKQFVYRGGPVEQIGEFCFRIQREYPDAEVAI